MDILNVRKRCEREFKGSTTAVMIAVAYSYYGLFYKWMTINIKNTEYIRIIDREMIKIYKNQKAKLL